MPTHTNCLPWCAEQGHDPGDACYYIAAATVDGGDKIVVGLYGTPMGIFLAVNGRAIHPDRLATLLTVYQRQRARMQTSRIKECGPDTLALHMSWCTANPDHIAGQNTDCTTLIFGDADQIIELQGAPGDVIGLAVSAFTETPPMCPHDLLYPAGSGMMLTIAELDYLFETYPRLAPLLSGTRAEYAPAG